MDQSVVLTKCITLLYLESLIEKNTESSADLVRTAIEKIQFSKLKLGDHTTASVEQGLKEFVIEMCRAEPGHIHDAPTLLQQIRIITQGHDVLYKAIAQGLEKELEPNQLKHTVSNLKKSIQTFFRDCRAQELLSKCYRDFTYSRATIPDTSAYLRTIIDELSVLSSKANSRETSIVKTLDIGDDSSLEDAYNDVSDSNGENLCFKTGWRELNDALFGGPRPGDTVIISALQHNYKTGASLTMAAHIATHNKPKCQDPTKKPLIYRVSLEDPIRNNAQFLYQLLKYEETGEKVSVKGTSIKDMSLYVRNRLRVNGYHFIIDEVDPSTWTYQTVINRVIELESQGYHVEVLSIDYIAKLPTTGCTQGASGDDYLDMLTRLRAWCSAREILLISPWQLSTEAMRKLETVPADQFLKTIKGTSLYEKAKGISRIFDIGILVHKVEAASGDYLNMVVEKHRFPQVADSSIKEWFLRMPANKMPIPANVGKEDYTVIRKIPRVASYSSNEDY